MSAPFKTFDAPGLDARPFKVIAAGAGLSGIHLAARMREFGKNIKFTIYEKNHAAGGTWLDNNYPGVACDVPSHAYTYPEHPFPFWTNFQAPGSSCLQYVNFLAEKVHLEDYAVYNTKIDRATWDDARALWVIECTNTKTGESFKDEANVFINTSGLLSQPKFPNFDWKKFKGLAMHTAQWDPSTDFKGKKVALIGVGSSALQTLPALQKQCAQVDMYIKSNAWVTPLFGGEERDRFWDFKDGLLAGMESEDPARINPEYTKEQIKKLTEDPECMYQHRKKILHELNGLFSKGLTRRGSAIGKETKDLFESLTKAKLASKPELERFFVPDYTPGCKRPTPSVGFYNAVTSDNVECIAAKVVDSTSDGLLDEHGVERKYDIIAYATGFSVDFRPPFEVIGKGGYNLRSQEYRDDPQSYFAFAFPRMPNYFSTVGPFTCSLNGEFLVGMAKLGDMIMKSILKLQRYRYKSMEVKKEAIEGFVAYAEEFLEGSIHKESCSAWYAQANTKAGKMRTLWPGSIVHMVEMLQDPNWEDFDFVKLDGEETGAARYNWLGKGLGRREVESEDYAPYVPIVQDVFAHVPQYGDKNARRDIP